MSDNAYNVLNISPYAKGFFKYDTLRTIPLYQCYAKNKRIYNQEVERRNGTAGVRKRTVCFSISYSQVTTLPKRYLFL